MATTATRIEETLTQDTGSSAGAGNAESAASAAGAYPSDEQILGMELATETPRAGAPLEAKDGVEQESKEGTINTESAEGTENKEKNKSGERAGNREGREESKREVAAQREISAEFQAVFATPGAGPKLREIFEREAEYRELFPSVDQARDAREASRELARVDELFESGDPAAHVELMAGLAQQDPRAFRSLAATFGERLAEIDPEAYRVISGEFATAALEAGRVPEQIELLARAAEKGDVGAVKFLAEQVMGKMESLRITGGSTGSASRKNQEGSFPTGSESSIAALRLTTRWSEQRANGGATRPARARTEAGAGNGAAVGKFVEGVNTEIETTVQQAIGGRVTELLPDAAEGTRQKIAGEIYRELDAALKKDQALRQQVNANLEASNRSGQFGGRQRTAMAALVMGKAKALLPGVAKRVVGEWTAAVVGASQARRNKQGASASRADVGVGGAPRPVSTQASRVDYRKLSDEEILNAE